MSAHKGYIKSGLRVPFIAGKNISQVSSTSSTMSASQSEGNKTSGYTGNRILALVVVSLVTFAETAHQNQVISRPVRVTLQKMFNFVWMMKNHENSCAVDLLMVHLYLLYVEILVVVVPFFLIPCA